MVVAPAPNIAQRRKKRIEWWLEKEEKERVAAAWWRKGERLKRVGGIRVCNLFISLSPDIGI